MVNHRLTLDTEELVMASLSNDNGALLELIKREYSYKKNKRYSPIFKIKMTGITIGRGGGTYPKMVGVQIDDGDIAYGDIYTGVNITIDIRRISKLIIYNNDTSAAYSYIDIILHNWQPFIFQKQGGKW